ncbi:MAG: selenide, water dikinase SelD [Thiotrichaceae bacterium]|nr:selenide, water dikinase SelD [Thiotrichaceae bacterium]
MDNIRLTEYSHGAGCGCKISPALLDRMLQTKLPKLIDPSLLVGNEKRDDAAVYDLGNGTAVISTTDFFMPIVDDPFTFGRIAATNAISDIYAMGGTPIMAIAIFGWPLDKLPAEVGQQVIEGGRQVCLDAGISLAGGHSIDAPEPIFGLAVTGIVPTQQVKENSQAQVGDHLFLTKPLGIGILTTAQKKKLLQPEHQQIAIEAMCRLNNLGALLAKVDAVHAMTDVTGFGFGGHCLEMCRGSDLQANINFASLPLLDQVEHYLAMNCSPGGAGRNFDSYGQDINELTDHQRAIVCDPQTSGGLLVSVAVDGIDEFLAIAKAEGFDLQSIGEIVEHNENTPYLQII